MSSLGLPVVLAIVLIALLVMMLILCKSVNMYVRSIVDLALTLERDIRACIPDIEVESITVSDRHVLLNLTNTNCPVDMREAKLFDVIVYYMYNSTLHVEWVEYNPKGGVDTWYIVNTYRDMINPIRQSDEEIYGVWDPGETIELNVTVQYPIDKLLHIVIALPQGYVYYIPGS